MKEDWEEEDEWNLRKLGKEMMSFLHFLHSLELLSSLEEAYPPIWRAEWMEVGVMMMMMIAKMDWIV